MGADGGTVPTRKDQVKVKQREEKIEGVQLAQLRLSQCALSGAPLAKESENLACDCHGNLFNFEAILEALVNADKKKSLAKKFGIKKMKDVTKLKATMNPDFVHPKGEEFVGPFLCPFSGHVCNGVIKFVAIRTCGHVMSQKALKEMTADNAECKAPAPNTSAAPSAIDSSDQHGKSQCIVCQAPFSWTTDVIELVHARTPASEAKPSAATSAAGAQHHTSDNGISAKAHNEKKRNHVDISDSKGEAKTVLDAAEKEPVAKKAKLS